ncbi:unnamed protein product [Arctogadus glacialis]
MADLIKAEKRRSEGRKRRRSEEGRRKKEERRKQARREEKRRGKRKKRRGGKAWSPRETLEPMRLQSLQRTPCDKSPLLQNCCVLKPHHTPAAVIAQRQQRPSTGDPLE